MAVGFVYCVTNTVNGKKYIGITTRNVNKRWHEHKSRARYKDYTSSLHNAIRKYGEDKFTVETLCSVINDLYGLEQDFIKEYNTVKFGYNLTYGGEGYVPAEETKRKISLSKMGHSTSLETREKLAKHNRATYIVRPYDGPDIEVTNLKQFCLDNNIYYTNLLRTQKYPQYSANNFRIVRKVG